MSKSVVSLGPQWAHLVLPQTPSFNSSIDAPILEFAITDGNGSWDKPSNGSNYQVHLPGSYSLAHGTLRRIPTPRVLVITDLDDTLVGDDEATLNFTEWWRSTGGPAGGRLVYNTGRALQLFLELLETKTHCLPEPDMLISAVGTKIYSKTPEGSWAEDMAYGSRLSAGWNLDSVRDGAYKALVKVGKDAMHFRPPHEMNEYKVTAGVLYAVLPHVLQSIEEDMSSKGMEYRAVVSGKGDWRFVDLVPKLAGKAAAMAHVREVLGFDPEETVACGDSGNDRDMLEAAHHAIVVGNAQEDLMAWARESQGRSGAPLVVDAWRAHGVLEGLERLGFKE
jgi:sucrose-6F-phosphate phosphohydrolase